MSLKLFLLNTFGGIKATSVIEAERESLLKDYQSFTEIEQSDKLKEFLDLQEKINSGQFKASKAAFNALKFKGSPEENQFRQYQRLAGNKRLKKYDQTATSPELERYETLKKGSRLNRFFELQEIVRQGFKKSDETGKAFRAEYKTLKSSDDVRFFHRYQKSYAYRNYLRMHHSEEKRKLGELKAIIESEKFKKRKAYLEDPKKWDKTPEYAMEQKYFSMKNSPEIVLFYKYRHSTAFNFFREWEVVFEDRFESENLDLSKWKTISHQAEKTVGRNFSQEDDLQAFTDGANIRLEGSNLQIQIKKEKLSSMVWKPAIGFIEQEFDYSSGTLTTGSSFRAQYGILEAKVKFAPDKRIQDVFYMADEDNSFRLSLMECGAKNQLGVSRTGSGKVSTRTYSLSGLPAGKSYIFRMVWDKGKISWLINETRLFTIKKDVPDSPLFLNMVSLMIAETSKLPHNFEINWVRFYQRRKQ